MVVECTECNAHLVTQQALLQHRGALLGGIRFNTLVIDTCGIMSETG